MARFEREARLLTYWSDLKLNPDSVNGFPPESNLCILNSTGKARAGASRPLYAGRINCNVEMDVDEALGAQLRPIDIARVVVIFAPGKLPNHHRMTIANINKTRFYELQHIALLAVAGL